jgi:hypothetical protein
VNWLLRLFGGKKKIEPEHRENDEARRQAREVLAQARQVLADRTLRDDFSIAEDEMRNGRRR